MNLVNSELLLVNYRHVNSEACKSIISLSLEDAKKLAENLYKNSSCKAHRRFGDVFVSYYQDRKKVEQWIFDNFIKLGGTPKLKHPIYFTLQDSKEFADNFYPYKEIKLRLNEIEDEDISFTFGDSMKLYYDGTLNKVFTKKELLKHLELIDRKNKEHLSNIIEQYGIIEAQVWNDKYC